MDWPLPQPEVVLPKLLNCVPASSGRPVSMPPVPRACSEPTVPPSLPVCRAGFNVMPFRNVSLLLYGSRADVNVFILMFVSVPGGQNRALRVPFGCVITTSRVGAVAGWLRAWRASSQGMAADAARPPRSRFRLVNRRGFMGVPLASLRDGGAIPEGIGLGHGDDQLDQIAARAGERALQGRHRAGVIVALGPAGGIAEPLRRHAVAHLLAAGGD